MSQQEVDPIALEFVKQAHANGVDLNQVPEQEIEAAYARFREGIQKAAQEHLEKQAAQELLEKQAAQKRLEEDFMSGRVIAQGFLHELEKHAAAQAAATQPAAAPQQTKQASALTKLAFPVAIAMAEEQKHDGNVVRERIEAAFTLGMLDHLEQQTKVAHAKDQEHATNIRALEMLEIAGYQVKWPPELSA